MGNPKKGSKAYKFKLLATRLRKRKQRKVALKKDELVQELLRESRQELRKRLGAEFAKRVPVLTRKIKAAAGHARENRKLKGFVERLSDQNEALTTREQEARVNERTQRNEWAKKEKEYKKTLAETEKELQKTQLALDKWTRFWSLVQNDARVGTVRYLERLRAARCTRWQ